ncbi:hypothetical protein SDC9_66771 [bioreactor metagenome]|uniref:Flagellar M-ring C-terminal domain-containing protein n=1 Tax=bioreactor metagenome TaxID=1076179 RepID=A0A644XVU7_9ZZZZ
MWLKIGIAVIAVIALLYFVRMYVVRRREREDELEMQQVITQAQVESDLSKSKELTPQEKEQLEHREAVEKFAKSKPEDVAQLIKAWLADE